MGCGLRWNKTSVKCHLLGGSCFGRVELVCPPRSLPDPRSSTHGHCSRNETKRASKRTWISPPILNHLYYLSNYLQVLYQVLLCFFVFAVFLLFSGFVLMMCPFERENHSRASDGLPAGQLPNSGGLHGAKAMPK